MAKKKFPRFVTPAGIAIYPSLTNPDYGTDDFPKPDGEFKVNLKLTADDAAVLIEKLQPMHDQAVKDAKEEFKKLKPATKKKLGKVSVNPLFEDVFDEDENETGEKVFKFKRKYSGTTKQGKEWKARIGIFDTKLKALPKGTDIWGGSELKVSFEARPYFIPGSGACGVSLSLLGVQVIDLVGPGQQSAESLGFGEEEGFESEETKDNDSGFEKEDGYDGDEDGDGDEDPDF